MNKQTLLFLHKTLSVPLVLPMQPACAGWRLHARVHISGCLPQAVGQRCSDCPAPFPIPTVCFLRREELLQHKHLPVGLNNKKKNHSATHGEAVRSKNCSFCFWGPPEHCSCTFTTFQPLLFPPPSITQALLQQLLVGVIPHLIRSVAYLAFWLQHRGT